MFSVPAVFESSQDQNDYLQECQSEASNPDEGLHHGTSLLTAWEHVEEHILGSRKKILEQGIGEEVREFFVNKRDAPIFSEAGSSDWHETAERSAILSQYTDNAPKVDISFPNLEDYRRCFPGHYFGNCKEPERGLPDPPEWKHRRSCAIFRGGATGGGTTPETNQRLLLAHLSQRWSEEDLIRGGRGIPLLDAKLTSWNKRQKIGPDGMVRVIDVCALRQVWGIRDVGRHNYLTWSQQARFKYTVYLDGNVGAGRLGALLGLGFVVVAPPSERPATFLRRHMQEFVHYIPVKKDLSDLRDAIVWLRNNDEQARLVAERALALHGQLCEKASMEAAMGAILRGLPCPRDDDVVLLRTLRHIWENSRSAIYVLVNLKRGIAIFAPFANKKYENEAGGRLLLEGGSLGEFLKLVKSRSGETVSLLPPTRWWTNGHLVCNVMPDDVWGESMLAEIRLLIENSFHPFSNI